MAADQVVDLHLIDILWTNNEARGCLREQAVRPMAGSSVSLLKEMSIIIKTGKSLTSRKKCLPSDLQHLHSNWKINQQNNKCSVQFQDPSVSWSYHRSSGWVEVNSRAALISKRQASFYCWQQQCAPRNAAQIPPSDIRTHVTNWWCMHLSFRDQGLVNGLPQLRKLESSLTAAKNCFNNQCI